jgi:hypothetical protein
MVLLWAGIGAYFAIDVLCSVRGIDASHREVKNVSRQIFRPIRALTPGRKPVLVMMPLDPVLEKCFFFWRTPTDPPCAVVPYGWLSHSPLFAEILHQNHLNPYSTSCVDNPAVFFVMEPRWIIPLKTFYEEHYRKEIRFDLVLNTDGMPSSKSCGLHVYRARFAEHNLTEAPTS